MNPSTNDQVEGTFHEVKGKIKEKAGQMTNNPDLESEGQVENLGGKKGRSTMLILLVILLLVLASGGGYYGHRRWGYGGGAGIGLGTILIILLLVYMFGFIH